ncbi:DUF1127 domain-containing protein [Acidihalobacter prosperus]|uniref:DUF1127 domain-containing protein n=1 Tax=Acidihalobacter prosperus TaxID=160660 RepID=A0A1A6C4H3_9GAMM|nr:hypothetical protein [Acidihalobacter prosperus]OBS09440.1 hypothetical protein Thpro_021768 [Acidihalobacter prosperus]
MKQRDHRRHHPWRMALHRRIALWLDIRRQRRMLEQLLTYDDHLLDDLGYHRQDLLDALALPWHADALARLAHWREARRSGRR